MSELLEYRIAERFDEGRWPSDGWARIMCRRAVRMPEPSVSEARA
ncbi:hypothetical protein ACIBG0_10450 [Nocardia sp. NPDC050630]